MEPLPDGGKPAQAKEICLRLLTDRARSRFELADKLAARGFSTAVSDQVLDRLTEVGLIDDAAFAQQWVYSRHTYSGKGKKALAEELRRKGIAPEVADEALSTITSDDELSRAADLVRRKLRTFPEGIERQKAITRLVGMLARRGYDPGTAFAVVAPEVAAAGLTDTRKPPPPSSRRTPPDESAAGPEDSNSGLTRSRTGRAASSSGDSESAPDESTSLRASKAPRLAKPASAPNRPTYKFGKVIVPDDDADSTPDEDSDPAADLVRRKLRTFPPNLDRQKAITRLVGMLARRGYNQSTAYTIVKAELAAADLDRP